MPETTPVRISYCSTCGNRLADLQQTLPRNLAQLAADEELVLIDYGSTDGMRQWVLDQFPAQLAARQLRLYTVLDVARFIRVHAKNIAHLLGRGRVLVNLDADNFLTADWLNLLRQMNWEVGEGTKASPYTGGARGRLVLREDIFRALGGYNEQFSSGYGYEEIDLELRAEAAGYTLFQLVPGDNSWIPTPLQVQSQAQVDPRLTVQASNKNHRLRSEANRRAGQLVANQGCRWAEARLLSGSGKEHRMYSEGTGLWINGQLRTRSPAVAARVPRPLMPRNHIYGRSAGQSRGGARR